MTGVEQLEALNALPAYKRERVLARLAILDAAQEFVADKPQRTGLEEFCTSFNAERIALPSNVRDVIESLNVATIYRWRKKLSEGGVAALADNYGTRAGTGRVSTSDELQTYLLALLYEYPHIQPAHALRAIEALRADLVEGVTADQIRHWLERWKSRNKQLYAYVTNPDQWKSHFRVAFGQADEDVVRLNQIWELDSTPSDVALILSTGQVIRHSILGCIDVYSRRLCFLVTPTSKATAIAALVRSAMLKWGVPESIRTDRGQDYASVHLRAVFKALGIKHRLCMPFASEQKPFIERAFKSMSHDLMELVQGYVGHNVVDVQRLRGQLSFEERLNQPGGVIEVRKSPEELQHFLNTWVDSYYQQKEHAGLGGWTPNQRVAAWTEPVRMIGSDQVRALDVLLSESAGTRVVTKKGIQIDGATFDARELAPLIGQRVQPKLDAADAGRIIVYDEDNKFVCVATAPELQGITGQERASIARKAQRQAMTEGARELREKVKVAAKELEGRSLADAILAKRDAQVLPLPAVTRPYTSPGLEEAQKAVDAGAGQLADAPVVLHPKLQAAQAREDDDRAFRRAQWNDYQRLKALADEGRPLSADEQSFVDWFPTTSLYRAMCRLAADENSGANKRR